MPEQIPLPVLRGVTACIAGETYPVETYRPTLSTQYPFMVAPDPATRPINPYPFAFFNVEAYERFLRGERVVVRDQTPNAIRTVYAQLTLTQADVDNARAILAVWEQQQQAATPTT